MWMPCLLQEPLFGSRRQKIVLNKEGAPLSKLGETHPIIEKKILSREEVDVFQVVLTPWAEDAHS